MLGVIDVATFGVIVEIGVLIDRFMQGFLPAVQNRSFLGIVVILIGRRREHSGNRMVVPVLLRPCLHLALSLLSGRPAIYNLSLTTHRSIIHVFLHRKTLLHKALTVTLLS